MRTMILFMALIWGGVYCEDNLIALQKPEPPPTFRGGFSVHLYHGSTPVEEIRSGSLNPREEQAWTARQLVVIGSEKTKIFNDLRE